MFPQTLSFKSKLAVLFLLISVLPLLTTGWFMAERADRELLKDAEEQLARSLLFKKMLIEQYLHISGEQLRQMASTQPVVQGLAAVRKVFPLTPPHPDTVAANTPQPTSGHDGVSSPIHRQQLDFFRDLLSHHTDYANLFLLDYQTGQLLYTVQEKIPLAASTQSGLGTVWQQILSQDKGDALAMTDFFPDTPAQDNAPFLLMAVPVSASGVRIGLLAVQIHLHTLEKIVLDGQEIGQTEVVALLNPQGVPISRYGPGKPDRGSVSSLAADFTPTVEAKTGMAGVVHWIREEDNTLLARVPLNLPGLHGSLAGTLPLFEAMAPVQAMNHAMAVILLSTLLCVSLLAIGSGKILLSPLRNLADTTKRIADGDWSARVMVTDHDEWGLVGISFNRMAERVEQQYWVKENLARMSGLLQSIKGLDALTQTILRELLELLNAAHGAFYLLDNNTGRYVATAAYHVQPLNTISNSYALGEGIVGRCALERKMLSFDNLPDGLWSIDTGLGPTQPVALLALPMHYQGQSKGVIIIASYYPFSPIQRQLLEEFSLFGGIALDNLERIFHIEELLEETRNQAAELEMSQQELEQMNQELESTSHTLRLSEESMRDQKEELEQTNRMLEEQTQLLSNRNEQLEQARTDLERTGRYKSEFLASMSHELRTPLNSILILAKEFMKNEAGNLAADQTEAAEVIYQSGKELLEMINELLDLARIEAGQVEMQIEEMVPEGFVDEIRRQFAPQAKEKGLDWQVVLDAAVPESISIDLAKVRRIVKNLVANALKFTQQGGVTVWVGSAPEKQHPMPSLLIAVSDTGCGIAPEDQTAVFDAFRQLKRKDGLKQGGVGLGLSICRKLAERIGGEIRLESEPGRGSTFTLLVPGEQPDRKIASPTPPTSADEGRSRGIPDNWLSAFAPLPGDSVDSSNKMRRLLLIEDDPVFAQSVSNLAGNRGFQVEVGSTGQAGLVLAVRHQPHGILLDLGLPDMHGEEVLARLREDARTRHIPVHIVSGQDDPGEALRAGSMGFLSKPAEDADIVRVLNRLVPVGVESRRLLLVEDHAEMRKSVLELVKDLNVTVVEAANGVAALASFGADPFDCIVLDLGLPDMDGTRLLEQMAAMRPLPPVVIHSARDLTRAEYDRLQGYTDSIIVKGAQLEMRLREEIILFLHHVIRDNPEAADTAATQARHRDEYWDGKTVLLVDDDVRNLFSMTRNLEKKGLKVRMAGNGAEAIQMLEAGQPVDIVLMDIMMPVMDGYEAMRKIRTRDPFNTLPILALTAKAMPEDRKKCLEAGADDYLSKPVDMDRLFEMMRIWIRKKEFR
ncbi:MAG: response regulator [Magnetococcales bacterium]|nr:response regulator [Magnetococcales bacterium]